MSEFIKGKVTNFRPLIVVDRVIVLEVPEADFRVPWEAVLCCADNSPTFGVWIDFPAAASHKPPALVISG